MEAPKKDVLLVMLEACDDMTKKDKMNAFSGAPLPVTRDYGLALAVLERALAHIKEAIPNGQENRAELAVDVAGLAIKEIDDWLSGVIKRAEDEVRARKPAKVAKKKLEATCQPAK
jgi:septation ring formation regulator EzrA